MPKEADPEIEKEVITWVEKITGCGKGGDTVAAWLHDGKVLCALANTISPGAVKKVNESSMPFKQMENITNFMHFARATGVPESSMFGTPDLFEEKNMASVVMGIYTFGGAVQTAYPGFAGPKLGVAMVASKDAKRNAGPATQMGGLSATCEVERPKDSVGRTGLQDPGKSPRPGGASPRGASPRPASPRPSVAGGLAKPASPRPGGASPRGASPRPIDTGAVKAASPRPGRDSGYGLDAELKAKQDANYDHDLEKQVVTWVEQVSGQSKGDLSVADWLHDGSVLGALFNGIKPGTIKVNTSKLPFKQMENIKFFTDACRKLGVAEYVMFATPDLYEEKNIGSVIKCIYALGGEVQKKVPEFTGPKLGLASTNVQDKARQKVAATQGGGFAGTQEVKRPEDRGAQAR